MVEDSGSAAKAAPEQIGATAAKVGVIFGFTVIVKVVVVAHCPAVGLKVSVVEVVLSSAGNQVPVIGGILVEDSGSAAKAAPEQIGTTAAKVGKIFGLTVIANVVVVAHCPAVGVKV